MYLLKFYTAGTFGGKRNNHINNLLHENTGYGYHGIAAENTMSHIENI